MFKKNNPKKTTTYLPISGAQVRKNLQEDQVLGPNLIQTLPKDIQVLILSQLVSQPELKVSYLVHMREVNTTFKEFIDKDPKAAPLRKIMNDYKEKLVQEKTFYVPLYYAGDEKDSIPLNTNPVFKKIEDALAYVDQNRDSQECKIAKIRVDNQGVMEKLNASKSDNLGVYSSGTYPGMVHMLMHDDPEKNIPVKVIEYQTPRVAEVLTFSTREKLIEKISPLLDESTREGIAYLQIKKPNALIVAKILDLVDTLPNKNEINKAINALVREGKAQRQQEESAPTVRTPGLGST